MAADLNRAIWVDIEKGEVWRAALGQHLTPAECRLLVLLGDREGRPVSAQAISRELDQDPCGDGGGSPRYHILNLRRKLGHSAETPIIRTTSSGQYYLVYGALRFVPEPRSPGP